MDLEERWLPIPGHESYSVSDRGRVWSSKRSRALRPSTTGKGRKLVRLDGKTLPVSRLVLLAFAGPCPPGLECCHGNDDPADNRLSNLRWDTHRANERDKARNGGRPPVTRCINGHEYTDDNTIVTSQGKKCRACKRERANSTYAAEKFPDGRQCARPGCLAEVAGTGVRYCWDHAPRRNRRKHAAI